MKEMLLALLLLIIGFVLLIKGADFLWDTLRNTISRCSAGTELYLV
jgi:Ca2+/Na+ antiporter